MRYLNKIVFINSAHIRYAELRLDGNVHFIGTQGVGKSTVLRAILFFYNADKMRLGIHLEQKDFDEFYLPSADSFIVYEVKRENGSFCVVVYRNQGRAAFRFIDSEYKREYFVDEATGDVIYEWGKIRNRVGKAHVSNVVNHYKTYRDIIYGNRQEAPADMRRYSLMESEKYLNVYRTIQNIFLNQSLESRVVKDIIISSMDFADGGINLDFYRDKVKDFRQQYDDIWMWYRKDKGGKVKARQDAAKVDSTYRLYRGTADMVGDLSRELLYAYQRDQQTLPRMQDDCTTVSAALDRQRRLLGEEEDKHKAEREDLLGKDEVLKDQQAKARKRRQHYQEVGIDHIVEMMAKEEILKTERLGTERQLEAITSKDRTVKEKYDALVVAERQRLADMRNQNAAAANEVRREANEKKAALQKAYTETRDASAETYRQRRLTVAEKLDAAKETWAEAGIAMERTRKANPFENEMAELQAKTAAAQQHEAALRLDTQKLQQQIDALTAEAKRQTDAIEAKLRLIMQEKQQHMAALREDEAALQRLADSYKGSLAEWLTDNVDGWEDTFGKVLDEEAVLYNSGLEPRKADDSPTVFGISLNLDNVDRHVRTPDDVQRELAVVDEKIKTVAQQIATAQQEAEASITQTEEKIGKQIRPLRLEKTDKDAELQVQPQKIERFTMHLHELEAKLGTWRDTETSRIDKEMAEAQQLIGQLTAEQQGLTDNERREAEKMRAQLDRQLSDTTQECSHHLVDLAKNLETMVSESDRQVELLNAQMDAELKGVGVDTTRLASLRQQMADVERQLAFIDSSRQEYYNYQRDKDEYFDHEQELKDQRTLLKQKLAGVEDKYAVRRRRYDDAIAEMSVKLQELRAKLASITADIAATKSFIESDTAPAGLQALLVSETVKPLGQILADLREQIYRLQRQQAAFKEAVDTFRKNFSPQNTFHFNLDTVTDDDYAAFATDLHEFVANNKIEEYRQRISNVYVDIIRRISREVEDLMANRGKVDGMIRDINKDFEENNFVGIIKGIELRSVASNDRLMQMLLSIRDFVRDAGANLGEVNLFSDYGSVKATNDRAVSLLMTLIEQLDLDTKRSELTLSDTFKLEFRVRENDNDTGFVEKLSNVGSDGTDVLVKAMVNIMLLNVFKHKVSRRFGDFRLHCLMDEIGKLHPNNVKGILDFANKRNILLVNSSPTTYSAEAYRYTYALGKDDDSNTVATALLVVG